MKLSQYLIKQAQALINSNPELVALDMLKQAGLDEGTARAELAQSQLEKIAVSSMQSKGVDYDEALKMVKVAGVKAKDLPGFSMKISGEDQIELLQKTAQDVEALEDAYEQSLQKIAELEHQLEFQTNVAPAQNAIREKIASTSAFTDADLDAMMNLPQDTLDKIAHVSSDKPWKMGAPEGSDATSYDPLRAFILS